MDSRSSYLLKITAISCALSASRAYSTLSNEAEVRKEDRTQRRVLRHEAAAGGVCQQKRVAILLVRPRNIQHPLCLMIVRLSTTLLSPSPIYSALSIVYKNHTLKYSIGYARTSPYCNDHVPT